MRTACTVALAAFFHLATAELKISSTDDIKSSAKTLADNLISIYGESKIPGLLDYKPKKDKDDDYQFWQSGAFFGSLIDYYRRTGDDSHNDLVRDALMYQSGDDFSFMPRNQTIDLTNAAQCMWGLSAMQAAEENVEEPPKDEPSWVERASNVFDSMASRVDRKLCDGGLRQGTYNFQLEYLEKDALSNGCLIALGARLALYTSNATYAKEATKSFEWMEDVGLIDHSSWLVNEKVGVQNDCNEIDDDEWSINTAVVLYGAAAMSNLTEGANMVWRNRTSELLDTFLANYVKKDLVYETTCEEFSNQCDTEAIAYKSLDFRWLGAVSQLAPYTAERIIAVLKKSGVTAAQTCDESDSGIECEFYWQSKDSGVDIGPKRDDPKGVSAKMSALDGVTNLLLDGMGLGTSGGDDEASPTQEDEAESTDEPSAAERVMSDVVVAVGAAMLVWGLL